ncbi:MAG: DNA replication/repair protein RecF [Gammaproteobacteria bacterium]|nr:DNA replication/repair protein RecF [Gammaproteobacteria bacterium]
MPLTRLDITDFRNLASIKIEPISTGFNVFYGLNGSGKTSMLEAIYYLGLGRSFRSTIIGRIIRNSTEKFLIFAHGGASHDQTISIGIERLLRGEMKIRIGGKDARSAAELAGITPVQLINSHCYNLLDAGPVFRRKYLDWGVFYLNQDFLRVWRDCIQILKQRNAALRRQRPKKELDSWTEELVSKAALMDRFRRDYMERLQPILSETLSELISISGLNTSYYPGWDKTANYRDILEASFDKDRLIGHTQFGPHRADLKITINKIPAKDILSRGQQKLFVCAMILAQGALLNTGANKKPIYLIDDLPAELDIVSRTNLIALLSKQETQIFVTAVEFESLGDALSRFPLRMFHVEHGNVTEVRR